MGRGGRENDRFLCYSDKPQKFGRNGSSAQSFLATRKEGKQLTHGAVGVGERMDRKE